MNGVLYVVATPIGNLDDISRRAIEVLTDVDLVLSEDTRHSKKLLNHLGIQQNYLPCHNWNEDRLKQQVLNKLKTGHNLALISDAGTPLISDPGYRIISFLQQQKIKIVPIPGASALISALCVSGLPTDKFSFFGFLPSNKSSRLKKLQQIKNSNMSCIVYESCHRILESLSDMIDIFGKNHKICIAREMTKLYENIELNELECIYDLIKNNKDQQKGEFTLVISSPKSENEDENERENKNIQIKKFLKIQLKYLPKKDAAKACAEYFKTNKQHCYKIALEL
ncbi:MAG: 16S rRNA (cytidine(1402)-2'-O)-methyltransferase [Gammaproteobacteria bacterium]|nr:MAG: 16S rRNA (cytidine(1402)-2'-O)-methyltransferase [Gammaproteobacteria bacterium]